MKEKNICQEFRLKNIHQTRNYLLQQIEQNELMNRKNKKICTTLNYIELFFTLASAIAGCISTSTFASLLCISIGITDSAIGLNIYAIAAGKKKKKKPDKIVLLSKSKLDSIEVLTSKALIDSNISHDEFVLINVLKKYDNMKEETKNLKT